MTRNCSSSAAWRVTSVGAATRPMGLLSFATTSQARAWNTRRWLSVSISSWCGPDGGWRAAASRRLAGLFDGADHVERLLGQVVALAVDDLLERADGVFELAKPGNRRRSVA